MLSKIHKSKKTELLTVNFFSDSQSDLKIILLFNKKILRVALRIRELEKL